MQLDQSDEEALHYMGSAKLWEKRFCPSLIYVQHPDCCGLYFEEGRSNRIEIKIKTSTGRTEPWWIERKIGKEIYFALWDTLGLEGWPIFSDLAHALREQEIPFYFYHRYKPSKREQRSLKCLSLTE